MSQEDIVSQMTAEQRLVLEKAGLLQKNDPMVNVGGADLPEGYRWFIATKKGYANMREIMPGERFFYNGKRGLWCHPEGENPSEPLNLDTQFNEMSRRLNGTAGNGMDESLRLLLEKNQGDLLALSRRLDETLQGAAKFAENIIERDAALDVLQKENEELKKQLDAATN
ncbi:MAG: hypothetical protein EXR86_12435 [Gammaproteobacteria bacterium]|nr:hypothetical protein [Gammaproteobacteria bacterium]